MTSKPDVDAPHPNPPHEGEGIRSIFTSPLWGGRSAERARGGGTAHRTTLSVQLRCVLFACVALIVLPAAAAPVAVPAKSPAPDHSLNGLFAALAKANSEEDAKPIEQQIEELFLQSNSASVDLLMTRASAALQAGDTATAKKLLDSVTDIAANYAEGWHQRAKLQAEANDDTGALVSFQKAVTLNPREFEAQVELGDMLVEYGQKAAGLASYRKALALDPHFEGLDKRVEKLAREVEGEKI
jgi:tetratricopeptide (TPR) repeat protein